MRLPGRSSQRGIGKKIGGQRGRGGGGGWLKEGNISVGVGKVIPGGPVKDKPVEQAVEC